MASQIMGFRVELLRGPITLSRDEFDRFGKTLIGLGHSVYTNNGNWIVFMNGVHEPPQGVPFYTPRKVANYFYFGGMGLTLSEYIEQYAHYVQWCAKEGHPVEEEAKSGL